MSAAKYAQSKEVLIVLLPAPIDVLRAKAARGKRTD